MRNTVLTLSALAALCANLFAGIPAAAAQAQGVSKTEILIGTIQDLSGPLAGYGKQARNGMQLRIDAIGLSITLDGEIRLE